MQTNIIRHVEKFRIVAHDITWYGIGIEWAAVAPLPVSYDRVLSVVLESYDIGPDPGLIRQQPAVCNMGRPPRWVWLKEGPKAPPPPPERLVAGSRRWEYHGRWYPVHSPDVAEPLAAGGSWPLWWDSIHTRVGAFFAGEPEAQETQRHVDVDLEAAGGGAAAGGEEVVEAVEVGELVAAPTALPMWKSSGLPARATGMAEREAERLCEQGYSHLGYVVDKKSRRGLAGGATNLTAAVVNTFRSAEGQVIPTTEAGQAVLRRKVNDLVGTIQASRGKDVAKLTPGDRLRVVNDAIAAIMLTTTTDIALSHLAQGTERALDTRSKLVKFLSWVKSFLVYTPESALDVAIANRRLLAVPRRA